MEVADQLIAKAIALESIAQELRTTARLLNDSAAGRVAVANVNPERRVGRRRKKLGIDIVVEVMRESGSLPLSRDEIVRLAALKGYVLTRKTVATYLSSYAHFKSLARDEWVLVSNYGAALQAKKQRLAAAMSTGES